MTILRYLTGASLAGVATLTLAGTAMASTVTYDTTGPGSFQETKITNESSVKTTNDNDISVYNVNDQSARTGNVSANENTSVGPASSGNAENRSSTDTNISLNNSAAESCTSCCTSCCVTCESQSETSVGGQGGGSAVSVPVGGKGGGVLGASTTAPVGGLGGGEVSTLPSVGASVPMDVSALRALYQPKSDAPTTNLAKQSQGISAIFLVIASVLSLIGAAGSAVYAQRKEQAKL